MSLMNALNTELVKAIGHPGDWMAVIRRVVCGSMKGHVRRGFMDDIVADVVSGIVVSKDKLAPKFQQALSSDDPENGVRCVLGKAARFRASDAGYTLDRWLNHRQLEVPSGDDENCQGIREASYVDHHDDMEHHVVNELEVMAVAHEWKRNTRLAKRCRLAQKVVPHRLAGEDIYSLMKLFDVPSTCTMQSVLNDIAEAVHRLGVKFDDPVLLKAGV